MPYSWKRAAAQGRYAAFQKCRKAALKLIPDPDAGVRTIAGESLARAFENLLKAFIAEKGGIDGDGHNLPAIAKMCHQYEHRLRYLLNRKELRELMPFSVGGFYDNPELEAVATVEFLRALLDFLDDTHQKIETYLQEKKAE